MFHRPRTKICPEGWYYLLVTAVVFIGAMVKEVNLLLLLAGMMLGLLLFQLQALFVFLRGLTVQRKAPQAVCAGDLLAVSLRLNNTRKRFGSWAITVEEQIQREPNTPHLHNHHNHNHDKAISAAVFFPYVPVGGERSGTYRGRLIERGRYRLGPVRVSTRFPFGLFDRQISFQESDTLYVYPRLGRLTRSWLSRHRKALAGFDRRQRRPGPEGDFYGVREWRSGDSMRLIHWRSSARTGKLVVRQFEQPRNRDVAIVVDPWLPEKPAAVHRENVELAISFAATVLADLCRQGGGMVHLAVYEEKPRCLGGPASDALLQDMMKTLAVVQAHGEDRLLALLQTALDSVVLGTEVVLVSTRPVDLTDGRRFASLWSDPLRLAARRHIRSIDASSEELKEFYIAQ